MAHVRDACNRCHGLKTRCVRLKPEHPICQRYERQGVSCNYSPPGQTGRPRGSYRRKTNSGKATGPASPEAEAAEVEETQITGISEEHLTFNNADYENFPNQGLPDNGDYVMLSGDNPIPPWLDSGGNFSDLATYPHVPGAFATENCADDSNTNDINQYLNALDGDDEAKKRQLEQMLNLQAKILEVTKLIEQCQEDKPVPVEDVFSISESLIQLAKSLDVGLKR